MIKIVCYVLTRTIHGKCFLPRMVDSSWNKSNVPELINQWE